MEKVLLIWIEDQTSHSVPLSQGLIQAKALSLFNTMKANKGEASADDKFVASRGWFHRFKKRCNLHNIKVAGEAASANVDAAQNYPSELAKIIEEGGYSKHQIFNVDETALYWKKMPSRTFIAKEEKAMSGFKPAKDRLTLLLGANAAGDFKLKPMMIYHAENPRALKNYAKTSLPVYYKSNKKAWMTGDLFTTWFTDYFKPAVQNYCREKKIPFKILLLSDNAPGHPRSLMDMYKEINVSFLPPNTTSLLQPMDQGVIAVFKALYLRRTFNKAIAALDNDTSDDTKKNKLQLFWKGYSILDAIKNIRDSWAEVKETTLQGVWKKLIPTLMDDFEGFELPVQEINDSVVALARELDLEVDINDVNELLISHDEPLSEEDLLIIDDQRRLFLESEANAEDTHIAAKEMTTKDLEEAIARTEEGMAIFERIDPNFERSSKVNAIVVNTIACYKEIVRERKRTSMRQTSLLSYFSSPDSPPSKRLRIFPDSEDEALLSPSAFLQ